ncbi:MAG TPA: hypothetical protein VHZ81_06640 [Galbitalea sp.]|nr:hypothetical protein [Galbitalea sp.]
MPGTEWLFDQDRTDPVGAVGVVVLGAGSRRVGLDSRVPVAADSIRG